MIPSGVLVKLNSLEEELLPTAVKLAILNAMPLFTGAEQRKARSLAGR